MLFSSLALSMLAGTALGAEHHVHERDVEYVTHVQTKYITANRGQAGATTQAVEQQSTVTTSPEVADHTSVAVPANTGSAQSNNNNNPTHIEVGSAGALGITYSPYSNDGGCKSESQIASEIAELSGYSVLRLYGVDCNQVAAVNNAKADGQKLFLGVYDVNQIESGVETMAQALNNNWQDVVTVSIGNELVNSGQASVEQVGGYVQTGRSSLQSHGYTGPVVAVDTFIATINNPGLCDYSDYVAINAHAYFDGNVEASQSGEWALQQIQRVWTACGGKKDVTIVESGWPSQGGSNGKAVASPENQQSAVNSIKNVIGNDVYLFTAFNDLWKNPGYLGSEQYWGIYGNSAN